MSLQNPNYMAGGNIDVSRFVKMDTTAGAEFTVLECSASTDRIVGVSQDGTHLAQIEGLTTDSYAARAGEGLNVYGPGHECNIVLGGTVVQGDLLTATTDGKAIVDPATGTVFIGGWALQGGDSGEIIRMFVHPMKIKYS